MNTIDNNIKLYHYFMKNTLRSIFVALAVIAAISPSAFGQKKNQKINVGEALQGYFTPASAEAARPDNEGFIRRWLLLEPISKANSSNRVFTDSYTRDAILHEYFPGQLSVLPKDGDKVKVEMDYQATAELSGSFNRNAQPETPKQVKATLAWHALDSDHFFVKLFRFASKLDLTRYGVIFWSVTVINCDEDIEDVRLAVGSNCGAMWWLNGEELLLMSGDRHMGVDSAVSDRITLKKGKNILRGCTINGVGMSEFCARFVDNYGNPVTNYTITCD